MKRNLLLQCSDSFDRSMGKVPQVSHQFVLTTSLLLRIAVCIKAKALANSLWVQGKLKPFNSHFCVVHTNLCGMPVRNLTYQKQLNGKFFGSAICIDYRFCNNWNPRTKLSSMTSVATSWENWLMMTWLWTSLSSVMRIREACVNTDQAILHNVWQEAEYRFDVNHATCGSHIGLY
jgi:hypothetical protein